MVHLALIQEALGANGKVESMNSSLMHFQLVATNQLKSGSCTGQQVQEQGATGPPRSIHWTQTVPPMVYDVF